MALAETLLVLRTRISRGSSDVLQDFKIPEASVNILVVERASRSSNCQLSSGWIATRLCFASSACLYMYCSGAHAVRCRRVWRVLYGVARVAQRSHVYQAAHTYAYNLKVKRTPLLILRTFEYCFMLSISDPNKAHGVAVHCSNQPNQRVCSRALPLQSFSGNAHVQ